MEPAQQVAHVVDRPARCARDVRSPGRHIRAFQNDGADLRAVGAQAARGGTEIAAGVLRIERRGIADIDRAEMAVPLRPGERRIGRRARGGEMARPQSFGIGRQDADPPGARPV